MPPKPLGQMMQIKFRVPEENAKCWHIVLIGIKIVIEY